MNKIEIILLNGSSINESIRNMVFAARLTQHGHEITCAKDIKDLYYKPASENLVAQLSGLPHPTIQKFGVINVVVVGASRRFLAQITRHQNEVKFMSASLQYSDYSDTAMTDKFVIPYNLLKPEYTRARNLYLDTCARTMQTYEAISSEIDNDSAGYAAPQSLRNVLLISATPYQWKHMISQRVCRRNTDETRYVMLKIWEALYNLNPILFRVTTTGPFCCQEYCQEGKMTCGHNITSSNPTEILRLDFPLLAGPDCSGHNPD